MTTYEAGEKLIYDNVYQVRFEGYWNGECAEVSEGGHSFVVKLADLRRPTFPAWAVSKRDEEKARKAGQRAAQAYKDGSSLG